MACSGWPRVEEHALGEMRKREAGRCHQSSSHQHFRAIEIGRGRAGHLKMHAARERMRQPALRADGLRIERQRVIELANCLRVGITR